MLYNSFKCIWKLVVTLQIKPINTNHNELLHNLISFVILSTICQYKKLLKTIPHFPALNISVVLIQ